MWLCCFYYKANNHFRKNISNPMDIYKRLLLNKSNVIRISFQMKVWDFFILWSNLPLPRNHRVPFYDRQFKNAI